MIYLQLNELHIWLLLSSSCAFVILSVFFFKAQKETEKAIWYQEKETKAEIGLTIVGCDLFGPDMKCVSWFDLLIFMKISYGF